MSILSAGTFFGALIAGDVADFIGRRVTIIVGCIIFVVGVILQVASTTVPLLVVGRVIAGIGVGFVSAIIILYMSEIAPKKVRGSIVAGYQLCITIGIFLASCVTYATENREDSGSYRIPMGIQVYTFRVKVLSSHVAQETDPSRAAAVGSHSWHRPLLPARVPPILR